MSTEALDRSNGGWQRIAELEREVERLTIGQRMLDESASAASALMVREHDRADALERELAEAQRLSVMRLAEIKDLERQLEQSLTNHEATMQLKLDELAEAQQARERAERQANLNALDCAAAQVLYDAGCTQRDILRGLLREALTTLKPHWDGYARESRDLRERITAALKEGE